MTRFCVQCNQLLGEKCARCGTETTPLDTISNGNAMTGAEFKCSTCGHRFIEGDGGETGGMCEPCLDAALRKAHEQAATSQRG